MGIFFTGDLLLELCGSTASNRWEEEILEGKVLTFDSVFFLPIKNVDQTKKFLTCKKSMLLKEECDVFHGTCAIAGIASLVPLCYHAFVVISQAINFSLWVFCASEVFSFGYFVASISRS